MSTEPTQSRRRSRSPDTAILRAGDSRSDVLLMRAIMSNLRTFAEPNVEVEISNGFVTIKGTVRTFRQKERVHRFLMGLAGVRALKNLLDVRPPETVADRKVALHIRRALDAHAELPPGTAVVHVRDGVATLRGNVRSAEERFIAENIASHCRGVSKVVNQIKVDPLEEVSDEATARAVRGALAYCDEFETDGVTISCAEGHVCLRGEVPTLLDRALAEEVARLQAGVHSVDNLIQVGSVEAALKNGSKRKSRTG